MTTDAQTRVSIVSADPSWLLQLAEVLAPFATSTYQSTASIVAEITNGRAGIVVVGPGDAAAFVAQPSEDTPEDSVIVVVDETSVELLRQAMFAGVADVVEVGRLGELPAAVRAQQQRLDLRAATTEDAAVPTGHGKVVVVTSAKAGQGSTTVAANLAVTLARTGGTALVEGDPVYGDLLSAFGYRQSRTELVTAEDVVGDHWLGRYLYRHPSGVVLAIPPPDTTLETFGPEHALDAMDALQHHVDTVVLDIPLWALDAYRMHRAADEVLFVTTDRTRDLAHARDAVRGMILPDGQAHLVISNYVDGRTPKRKDLLAMTGLATLGRIPESAAAESAFDKGEPVVGAKPKGPEAAAFEELAAALQEVLAPG
jgi:Flp pilus assembly CpaE family ATPase